MIKFVSTKERRKWENIRLIRHACGEGLAYVPIALRAQELWNELQKQTNERIFLNTGVITFGPSDSLFVQTAINTVYLLTKYLIVTFFKC